MPIPQSQVGREVARLETALPKQIANRKVIAMGRKNGPGENGLTESLASALQAADSEFGQILEEVDEISKLLKSNHPDTQTMRVATHPAVWGAVKQALLDRELRNLALTDDLTCLYNRRGFFCGCDPAAQTGAAQ